MLAILNIFYARERRWIGISAVDGCTFMASNPLKHLVMNITFNELRDIKDRLPDGSIQQIAKALDLNVETVWNYFGGYSHRQGRPMGVHIEEGPGGGIVSLDDTRILDIARRLIQDEA